MRIAFVLPTGKNAISVDVSANFVYSALLDKFAETSTQITLSISFQEHKQSPIPHPTFQNFKPQFFNWYCLKISNSILVNVHFAVNSTIFGDIER